MDEPTARDALELEVTDFGPIVEARLDLRPLTVFVGPSNTGKSYLAILIYALHRFFSGSRAPGGLTFRMPRSILSNERARKPPRAVIDSLGEVAQSILRDRQAPSAQAVIPLPSLLAKEIRSRFDSQGKSLGRQICLCFGVDATGALIRKHRRGGDARVVARRGAVEDSAHFEHELTLGTQKTEFKTTISGEFRIPMDVHQTAKIKRTLRAMSRINAEGRESGPSDIFAWNFMEIMGFLDDFVLPYAIGPLSRSAYYLPADRTGVMHAHSVVVSALIGSAPTAGLRPAVRTPMLSGVLADFLEQLIAIDHPRRPRRSRGRDLGANIEDAVLGGAVGVDRSSAIDYPRFTYRPDGWTNDLPLMNASSMVSELAPVVLYLRYLVHPGDVLIVEEPESHLHPAKQVEFTRQLAVLVRLGVRVIVTTHSEWLLEELANIVRRSELPEAGRDHNSGRVALRPDQVGAWLFEPRRRPRGSVVKEIRLDESGLYPSGFDAVAAALHNDWADISSRIEDSS